MSAAERMVADQIGYAIDRAELRIEQQRIHIRALANHPQEATKARAVLEAMLIKLANLQRLRGKFQSA